MRRAKKTSSETIASDATERRRVCAPHVRKSVFATSLILSPQIVTGETVVCTQAFSRTPSANNTCLGAHEPLVVGGEYIFFLSFFLLCFYRGLMSFWTARAFAARIHVLDFRTASSCSKRFRRRYVRTTARTHTHRL